VSCATDAIVPHISGDISTPNFLAMFCNVHTPLYKLSSQSTIMTSSLAKSSYFFVLVDKVTPFDTQAYGQSKTTILLSNI
jgi:hypothetical protein